MADSHTPDERLDIVLRLIRERRSVRAYSPEPVSREDLARLFQAALWAPSNWNGQPWRFYVVDRAADREAICAILAARVQALREAAEADTSLYHFVEHCKHYFSVLDCAPTIICGYYKPFPSRMEEVIASHLGTGADTGGWNPNLVSFGMAAQNLLLAASALGLGACFHSGPIAFLRGVLNEMLGLHPRLELAGIVTVGWPTDPPREGHRKPLARILQYVEQLEAR